MKIDEKTLKQTLEELYAYYFALARKADLYGGNADKAAGEIDAIGTIYLACFGGKKMMRLWLANCEGGD